MKKINKMLFIIMLLLCFYNITLFSNKKIIQENLRYLDKSSFINLIASAAVDDMKETGVYASVTLGQAAVESGWGNDDIAIKYNNYFGMKTSGKIYINGVETQCNTSNVGMIGYSNNTNEFWSGMAVCLKASEGGGSWFRVYDSAANSIKDHSRNLWCISDGRYITNGVFANGITPESQLYAIAKSGYAVDSNGNVSSIAGNRYDQYIYNSIILSNGFTNYDAGYQSVRPSYANSCTTAEYTGGIPSIPDGSSSNYNSSYEGNIRKGYIYEKQLGNSITKLESENDESLLNKINRIINNIITNAGQYISNSFEILISGDETEAKNWRQTSSSWGNISLGNSKWNISNAGCLATSVAIQMQLSGTTINSDNFNPGTFVQYLNQHDGFTSGGLFKWDNNIWSGLAPNFVVANSSYNLPASKNAKIQKIGELLNQGYYPVMCVKKECGHWVAVTGVSSDNINIIDPGSNATQAFPTYTGSNVTRVALFKKLD